VNLVWIRHLEHHGTAQVPESAVPIYRQSNWDVMSEAEVAEMEQGLAHAAVAAEQAMAGTPAGETATGSAPAAAPGPSPAPRKPGNKENQ
jgi:hypothetical protein